MSYGNVFVASLTPLFYGLKSNNQEKNAFSKILQSDGAKIRIQSA